MALALVLIGDQLFQSDPEMFSKFHFAGKADEEEEEVIVKRKPKMIVYISESEEEPTPPPSPGTQRKNEWAAYRQKQVDAHQARSAHYTKALDKMLAF